MQYLFIVDTNQYAGNFGREMGSYLTGIVGEYFSSTADELAKLYREETGDDDSDETKFHSIVDIHDSDGEHEPDYASIWRGKDKKGYHSAAFIFREMPTSEEVSLLQDRAIKFPAAYKSVEKYQSKGLKVLGFRWMTRDNSWKDLEI